MDTNSSRWQRLRKPLLALVLITCAYVAARMLRERVGIELSAESIQESVSKLGLWAPVGYVLLVMFRQLMVLPSLILLASAGIMFGAPFGTLLGGIGITLNAFTLFGTSHMLGRDWVLPRIHARWPTFEKRAETAGPWAIALMTGHPMGVLTPFHLAAGVTGISVFRFFVAVCPAAMFRAAYFSFLGANLLSRDSSGIWIASGLIAAVALLPLAHPLVRARLMKTLRGEDKQTIDQGDEQAP